jgi:hypothetical protein
MIAAEQRAEMVPTTTTSLEEEKNMMADALTR